MQKEISNILNNYKTHLSDEVLTNTPRRVSESLKFMLSGYQENASEFVKNSMFESECDEMVCMQDINFHSLCEHHLLPFFGTISVAYIPNNYIVGFSSIVKVINAYAKRLQTQENLCLQIANCLYSTLQPKGVGVIIKASHLCMQMKDSTSSQAKITTSSLRGSFKTNASTRAEFMKFANN